MSYTRTVTAFRHELTMATTAPSQIATDRGPTPSCRELDREAPLARTAHPRPPSPRKALLAGHGYHVGQAVPLEGINGSSDATCLGHNTGAHSGAILSTFGARRYHRPRAVRVGLQRCALRVGVRARAWSDLGDLGLHRHVHSMKNTIDSQTKYARAPAGGDLRLQVPAARAADT